MSKQNEFKAFKYDWAGACRPKEWSPYSIATFSVGIFQWLPKASGKGLKRGKVIYRVKGYACDPKPVYDRANEIVKYLNANNPEYLTMIKIWKSETVKR